MDFLAPGDLVDIVATSSQKNPTGAALAANFLESWGLSARVPETLFGEHPLYANTDEMRLAHLARALAAPDSKAVWCLRGGSGATRLLPGLGSLTPHKEKLLIGFSDVTAFHLFLPKAWGWRTVHGPNLGQMSKGECDDLTMSTVKDLLFGRLSHVDVPYLTPLNTPAQNAEPLAGTLMGGNFSLVEYSVGTPWQLDATDKIIFLEDVDELPYRTAERLEHLLQAGIWQSAHAIVFFDFTHNKPIEDAHHALQPFVLEEFASRVEIPVFRGQGVGHGSPNIPLICGASATIESGVLRSYAA
ncbi:MAG: LD-carboxypeptidase [Proteobacteria bacterium]|nr:LD-carboxypeptidase [Pseudomonadota bacterium]